MADSRDTKLIRRRQHKIQGIVQGVGFRPFVYRQALILGLTGWVRNTSAGVMIEIQGAELALSAFDFALNNSLPPLAEITSNTCVEIDTANDASFQILHSCEGETDIQIAPDSALCNDCLRELFDSGNRRYRYPFITCTNCGPRYSIITGVPYDRPKTTMSAFPLCHDCSCEYHDPLDRRFHAQPIACDICGPHLTLINNSGERLAGKDSAVTLAIELLRQGAVLAVKGISGYHLAVNACNPEAVQKLRDRKKRDEKPFAVMVNSLETAHEFAFIDIMEERLLGSPEAPIVIVRKRSDCPVSPLVAPGNGWLGLMLPYAPIHHLLFHQGQGSRVKGQGENLLPLLAPCHLPLDPVFSALVMTSGNISDEPVAFEDNEAQKRLAGIADCFLLHNRPIHIRSDDSVMRVFQGKPIFYRRARGYAPRAVKLPFPVQPLLAVGAELKGAICIASADKGFLSQHIGDLQNVSSYDSFRHTIEHLSGILEIKPELIACDMHPDYLSSRFAEESGLPLIKVQHHHAHLAACMAENGLDGEVIGVIFDGTGYGTDDTIWGGEFLVGGYDEFLRAAHFRPAPMPGGDAAVKEPWRMALSYMYQASGESAFAIDHPVANQLSAKDQVVFASMLKRGINSPLTSSCGRLFDAVAALLNIRLKVSYDGQAAIELEALAETAKRENTNSYQYEIMCDEKSASQLDFSQMFNEIVTDIDAGIQNADIALRFHITIASATTDMCMFISESTGLDRILLSGGVFQNRLLSEMVYTTLVNNGLKVFTHRLVPPNDGGIALGQAAISGRRKA